MTWFNGPSVWLTHCASKAHTRRTIELTTVMHEITLIEDARDKYQNVSLHAESDAGSDSERDAESILVGWTLVAPS